MDLWGQSCLDNWGLTVIVIIWLSRFPYLKIATLLNPGSANDFMALNTTLTFNKNTGRLCTSLNIIHDHIHEMEEEYEVVLFNDELPYYVRLNPNTLNIRVKNVERKYYYCLPPRSESHSSV